MSRSNKNYLEKTLSNNIFIQNIFKMLDLISVINKIYKILTGKIKKKIEFDPIKFEGMWVILDYLEDNTFNFRIKLLTKISYDKIICSFYDLLYIFFINVNILEINTSNKDMNKKSENCKIIDIKFKFSFNEKEIVDVYNYSIKEIILILNHIEKTKIKKQKVKEENNE